MLAIYHVSFQTANYLAGLSVTRDRFPEGVFLVIVVDSDDQPCNQYRELDSRFLANQRPGTYFSFLRVGYDLFYSFLIAMMICVDDRTKVYSLTISNQLTKNEIILAIFGAIGIFVSIYTLVFVISCVLIFKGQPPQVVQGAPIDNSGDAAGMYLYMLVQFHRILRPFEIKLAFPSFLEATDPNVIETATEEFPEGAAHGDDVVSNASSDLASDIDFRTQRGLFVHDLARTPERKMKNKITVYHWNLWTIAIFYA